MSPISGAVSLVGAGPGDPELLTVKAVRRLSEADLVLYDALISAEVLSVAAGARAVSVGSRAGRRRVPQKTINALMIRAAARGERVVRLKCGDPFVLGRGGEEALALAAAGVPVEVVPGITTAVAAPALAGIPVTHRGIASGFAVISGHAEPAYRRPLESIAPGSLTLIVLMGLANRAALTALLIERGWPEETPAALLFAASSSHAVSWMGTLKELSARSPMGGQGSPGTIVVGEVVEVGASLRRYECGRRPRADDKRSRPRISSNAVSSSWITRGTRFARV